jgi:hypothetical protein
VPRVVGKQFIGQCPRARDRGVRIRALGLHVEQVVGVLREQVEVFVDTAPGLREVGGGVSDGDGQVAEFRR